MSEQEIGLALQMKHVSKRFPGTIAVDDVSFEVYAGEVHALVGENGAGKSTLMKMLAGSFDDYTGSISINSREVKLHSPTMAKKYGIGMIYQELSLARPISIAENLLVGRLPTKHGFLDSRALSQQVAYWLSQVGLGDLDPRLPIEDISQHQAQLVEIAKVLSTRPCILVMDEPTSALSREEVERLFAIIDRLKKQGLAIVYISHHLPEIFRLADRVTVMRDGRKVATKAIGEVTREDVVQMMVGRSEKEFYVGKRRTPGAERLRVEGLTRNGFFHDISFVAHEREILGICGLSGAGRTELARVLAGIDARDSGTVKVDGQPVRPRRMAQAIRQGIAYLTEDRKTEGLALRLTTRENMLSGLIPRHSRAGIYMPRLATASLTRLIEELAIYPPDPERPVANLSGGNQQKVLLAKWMALEPKILILDEPTHGVDIGAKMTIHAAIERLADEGNTIILISSDLPELVGLADRVQIMRRGHFIREMDKEECTEESVLIAANSEAAPTGGVRR
ncbi:MAG: sugar ABC transporter ATP-binding protein [Rectinemataceae bacterium]